MQEQIRDSIITWESSAYDSISSQNQIFIETVPFGDPEFQENLYSVNRKTDRIPDWYFISILFVLSFMAFARIVYGKFMTSIWISAYSFQIASKTYKERGVVQQRVGLGLDLLYLVNASLFLYLLNRHFSTGIFDPEDFRLVLVSILVLGLLILVRIIIMRLTGAIFERSALFLGFLYHYFIYSKVLGMVLIPFLIAIPFTTGITQEILIYTGISVVFAVQLLRLFRVSIYIIKNVIFLSYLILYLCVLEILPILVVIKIVLSLAQV
jgi:hypothetical protein